MNKIIKRKIDPFTINLPKLDLHGETRDTMVFVVNDFINDNIKLKNKKIIIVHGKGKYVLRNKLKEMLNKNLYVKNFRIDPLNNGQSIIELKFDK